MPEKESPKFKLPYPTSAGEVKLGATDFEELALKLDTLLGEKVLIVKKYSGSGTLASGELAIQEESGKTFTLPSAATANQIIGIFSKVAETKITSASETIGDFTAAASYKLALNQHVLLQSDGVKWLILAGEPKRENVYVLKLYSKAEAEAGIEFSASRPTFVWFGTETAQKIEVGGVILTEEPGKFLLSLIIPAGQKLKSNKEINTARFLLL